MPRPRRAFSDDVTAANALIEEQRREITELQARLREAQESLDAIRTGEVDAVVVEGNGAQQVYTLESADRPYRRLIEEMQEGALMLSASGDVLYCNSALAEMLATSTESIVGYRPERFVAPDERIAFTRLVAQGGRAELNLVGEDGAMRPVQLSLSGLTVVGGEPLLCGIITDLTEPKRHAREIAEAQARHATELAESRRQLQFVADHAPVLIAQWDTQRHYKFVNQPYADCFGLQPADIVGQHAREVLGEEAYAHASPPMEAALTGHQIAHDLELATATGGPRTVRVAYAPQFDASGRVIGLVAAITDISERKRAEEHLRLVMQELSHRTKNLMAVVQSISWQTSRRSLDLEDFEQRFTQRIEALARSHDLLVERNWHGVALADLVRAQLVPFVDRATERVAVHGPALLLTPMAAQELGLALHELATNAAKYGALSVPAGKIDVGWKIDRNRATGGPGFRMTWCESGGPVVSPPTGKGFGSTTISNTISKSFNGEVKLDYRPEGLCWELAAPIGRIGTELSGGRVLWGAELDSTKSSNPLHGRRILVVEDVAVMAVSFEDVLGGAGAEVVGPALDLRSAERLVEEEMISAALLDIRFAEGAIWPLAQRLARKGVPFVFCTGHFNRDTLPAEWRGRPLLVKPARAQSLIDAVAGLFRSHD
jgi:PAS domain S-box-containing protein